MIITVLMVLTEGFFRINYDLSTKLNDKLQANDVNVYNSFEQMFLEVLNTCHAPCKKR